MKDSLKAAQASLAPGSSEIIQTLGGLLRGAASHAHGKITATALWGVMEGRADDP